MSVAIAEQAFKKPKGRVFLMHGTIGMKRSILDWLDAQGRCWPLRRVRVAVIPWNIAMLVATPLGGGHYLVDVLAGILVAIASIGVTKKISGVCSQRRVEPLSSDV